MHLNGGVQIIPPDFHSLFLYTGGMEKYLPQFEYPLFDLPRMKDEQIEGGFLLKTTLLVLKYILQNNLLVHFDRIEDCLKHRGTQSNVTKEFLHVMIKYIMQVLKTEDRDEFHQKLQQTLEEGALPMQTTAEYHVEEGMVKGLQQGREQETREAVLDNLTVASLKEFDQYLQEKKSR
ncbi:MAG: Rpn family recombination-promoting nuclease/putative transposase [bacterium]|jgi:hypothetical protein